MKNNINTIAFYIGSLGLGGAERVITNLANFFNSEGYKVYMVTKLVDNQEYQLDEGIERIVADLTDDELTKNRLINLYRRIKKLSYIWNGIKPDIIISFIRKNNLMALASTIGRHIPVVVCIRSAPERELSGKVMLPISKIMFRKAAGIVVQTNRGKEFFSSELQRKITVLPNSINPVFLQKNISRFEEGYVSNDRIITVGRIDDNKNQKLLIEAFSRIATKYSDWTLHIYGDGERRKQLEEYAISIGLDNRIVFYGRIDNVVEALREADIFVLPSKVEGMPNALIEAMAMGLACISTDCPCGGPADLIIDGFNGYLVQVDNIEQLTNRIEYLINNVDVRNSLMQKASDIALELHPDIVNHKWKDYIETIINEY